VDETEGAGEDGEEEGGARSVLLPEDLSVAFVEGTTNTWGGGCMWGTERGEDSANRSFSRTSTSCASSSILPSPNAVPAGEGDRFATTRGENFHFFAISSSGSGESRATMPNLLLPAPTPSPAAPNDASGEGNTTGTSASSSTTRPLPFPTPSSCGLTSRCESRGAGDSFLSTPIRWRTAFSAPPSSSSGSTLALLPAKAATLAANVLDSASSPPPTMGV
jgi:hypothetical protein